VTATKFRVIAAGCAAATAFVGLTACAATGNGNGQNAALAAATNGAPSTVPDDPTTPPPPAPTKPLTTALRAATIPKMGKVVTDQKGWVLYRFDKDTANPSVSNCEGKCAQVWPPALTDGNPELLGVDPAVVGTVIRADGSFQLTLAGWPVYRYIGDPKPGAWKGQNVGGTWFVVSNNGKKNLTCLPTPAPTAVTPPAAPGDPDTTPTPTAASGDGGNGGY
jgi:predicted lipoprotein with Yx(FWY)xxD motif